MAQGEKGEVCEPKPGIKKGKEDDDPLAEIMQVTIIL